MIDRDVILARLDALYDARLREDAAAMAPLWAPGGTIRLAGAGTVRSPLVPAGDLPIADVLGAFTEVFTWHRLERLTTIVDGTRAAVRSRVLLSHGGGELVDTEIMDDWRFDNEGQAVALVEFIDTAILAPLLGLGRA